MIRYCKNLTDLIDRLLTSNWIFGVFIFFGLLMPVAFSVRIAITYDNPVDFKYLWAAGQIWADGANPYAPNFSETAGTLFDIDGFHRWLYSPHVWGLSRGLATVDFETAFWVWTGLNVVLIYAGTWLIASAILNFEHRWHWAIMIFFLLYTASSIGASMSQTLGQYSAVTYFAIAAFVHAILRKNSQLMVIALIVVTMKASLGLAFIGYALVIPRWRASLLVAGVISLILSVPPFFISGVGPIVSGYLSGVAAYAGYEPNAASSMTGARNLVFYLTGYSLSGLLMSAVATVLVALIALIGTRHTLTISPLLTCLAVIIFFVPLHLYDLTLVSVLAIGCVRPWFAAIYILVLIGFYRVNRLSEALGIEEATSSFQGSFLASTLLAALLMAAIATFASDLSKNRMAYRHWASH